MMRIAYRCFPNLQNLIVIFRDGPAYIRKIIAQMVEYISIVCQFRLMQYAFIDKSISFKYLLRPLIMRIAIGSDKAELQFVESVVEYSLHRFRHISFTPIRFIKPLRIFQCYCPDILLSDKHILKNFTRFFYCFMGCPSGIIPKIRILTTSEKCFCIIFLKRTNYQAPRFKSMGYCFIGFCFFSCLRLFS